MPTIKLTAKRQATFPAEVCEQLGIRSGDALELKPLRQGEEIVWILKPIPRLNRSWIGRLKKYRRRAERPWTREEDEASTGFEWSKESGR